MPVAVKLEVKPFAKVAEAGLIAIAVSAGAVTVNVATLEFTPFAEAVTLVVPCAKLEAIPLVFKVATVVALEVQITDADALPVVPSE